MTQTQAVAVLIVMWSCVFLVLRRDRRVAQHPTASRARPPHPVAHWGQVSPVAMSIRRFRLPLAPVRSLFRCRRHAGVVVGTAAAIVRHDQLRQFEFAHLRHLVELFAKDLQHVSAPLPAAHARETSKNVVQHRVDSIGVRAHWVTVDFHQKEEGLFVMVVCSGVPSPGRESWVSIERYGALAYGQTRVDKTRGQEVSIISLRKEGKKDWLRKILTLLECRLVAHYSH